MKGLALILQLIAITYTWGAPPWPDGRCIEFAYETELVFQKRRMPLGDAKNAALNNAIRTCEKGGQRDCLEYSFTRMKEHYSDHYPIMTTISLEN